MIGVFSEVNIVVDWIFTQLTVFVHFLWNDCAWVGVLVIAFPLIRRVINIFKQILS